MKWLDDLSIKRYWACKYNSIAHFFMRNEETRDFIEWQLKKKEKRFVQKSEGNTIFFNLDEMGYYRNKGTSLSMR
jgi:hypothetical protein